VLVPDRRRRWQAIVAAATVVMAVVGAVVVAGGYGYARLRVDQVPSVHVPSLTPAPPPGRPMNLLVVGSDTRTRLSRQDRGQFGAVQGQRGDTILLVHLVPASHRAWMLSIPRDLYVPVPGTGGSGRVVDAIGGVRLDFPDPVRDDDNGHNNSGLLVATPGCRRLDGGPALALVRSRYFQYRGADGVWHTDPATTWAASAASRSCCGPWDPRPC
jgi:anionic cell wall polymer biosynthesis LytR-Cps2A-Psr (LCP) family protein